MFAVGVAVHHSRIWTALRVASLQPRPPLARDRSGVFPRGWRGNTLYPCSANSNALRSSRRLEGDVVIPTTRRRRERVTSRRRLRRGVAAHLSDAVPRERLRLAAVHLDQVGVVRLAVAL